MTAAALALLLAVSATIPHPDLSSAEPAVRKQMEVTRAALEKEADGTPRKAELYGSLGMIYHAYDLTAAAEACYRKAIEIRPEFRWHYYLGHVLADRGEADAAVGEFEAALRIDPTYLPGTLRLARLQLERRNVDEAARLYEQARAADPNEAEALTGLGRVAFARDDFAGAVARLNEALARAPHATEIPYLLGLAYARLGQRDRAREFLARGGDIRAVRFDSILRHVQELDRGGQEQQDRGTTLLADGQLEQALERFRLGVEARPSDPRARNNLGTARLRSGDVEGAAADFGAALALDPNYALAHFNLGTIRSAQRNDEAAVAHYRAALRVDPGLVPARFNLANALGRLGRHEEAVAEYRAVVEAEPANSAARLQEALALERLGRRAEARARLEEALRLAPDDTALREALESRP
jgi:tetratricopeptide (TPR) repeat protein